MTKTFRTAVVAAAFAAATIAGAAFITAQEGHIFGSDVVDVSKTPKPTFSETAELVTAMPSRNSDGSYIALSMREYEGRIDTLRESAKSEGRSNDQYRADLQRFVESVKANQGTIAWEISAAQKELDSLYARQRKGDKKVGKQIIAKEKALTSMRATLEGMTAHEEKLKAEIGTNKAEQKKNEDRAARRNAPPRMMKF